MQGNCDRFEFLPLTLIMRTLITGGTSGIGLGIAGAFAAKGHALELIGMEKDGEAIAQKLAGEYNAEVHFHYADLSRYENVKHLAEKILPHGTPDVIINNAGIQYVAAVSDFPPERWDLILSVNLSAAFYICHEFIPHMEKRRFGRIINIASAHGLVASEYKSAYVAAKHGLVGFTKVLALEGASKGITANAICPGYVRTPLVEKQIAEQAVAHGISEEKVIQEIMLAKQPVKQFIDIETLSAIALLIASPQSNSISGAVWNADGGWTAQ